MTLGQVIPQAAEADMDAYAADKARIFAAGTTCVLNRDDPRVMRMASPLARCLSVIGMPISGSSFIL